MNPSPSAQNPISQRLKKANPSSHFTPSPPSLENEQIAQYCSTLETYAAFCYEVIINGWPIRNKKVVNQCQQVE